MSECKPRIVSTEPLVSIRWHGAIRVEADTSQDTKDSKWLKLVKINYEDAHGNARTWEAMKRPTRPKSSAVDAIQILAILEKPAGPEVLLEKQFRPPTGKVIVEFPAGMVDEGETPEQAAVRELKEETGYLGEVISDKIDRPVHWNSPASSSSCTYMIRMKIDLSKGENQNPKPELEEGEIIDTFSIPLRDLYSEVRKLSAEGFAIDGKVGSFAEAMETARMWQGQ
ncbi:putative NUDIX hydrolase domain-like protein [Seiridium unicorne]|uniref:NUDIX hydrolase domain-like protein n=1 Tax=Seiridium unicorne TaxID=138068 RepID=A0ABR2UK70_9PEZI